MGLAPGVSRCSSQSELRPPSFSRPGQYWPVQFSAGTDGSAFPPFTHEGQYWQGLPCLTLQLPSGIRPPVSLPSVPVSAGLVSRCIGEDVLFAILLVAVSAGFPPQSHAVARGFTCLGQYWPRVRFPGAPPARVSGRRLPSTEDTAARSRLGRRGIMFGSLLLLSLGSAYHGRAVGSLMRYGSGVSSGTVPAVSVVRLPSGDRRRSSSPSPSTPKEKRWNHR